MSTSVTYKGNVIATVENNTKTLNTQGYYLEANIILTDVSTSIPDGDELGYGTERLTDLTGTSWRWNDTIEYSQDVNSSYNWVITSNGNSYLGITFKVNSAPGQSWNKSNYLSYKAANGNSQLIYNDQDGMNTTYQECTIVSGDQTTDKAIIAFFYANATQITPVE